MTYDEIWRSLARHNTQGEAKALARMIIEEKFGLSLADIICGGVERLTPEETRWLAEAVERVGGGEPVQYVLGWTWFCGHRFGVRPGVLIPRPETEWLVEHAAGARRVLDIGTGSGCIAVSVKLAEPQAYVEAWDISEEALGVASANALQLGADVAFRQCDALTLPTSGAAEWDTIISNPPYICQSERADMEANVTEHEPGLALFVPDDDPLLFYRAITHYALHALQPGGRLLFECNTRYADDTADMMRREGLADVGVESDCFGLKRFATGRRAARG